uniref:Uncharacterized protein n=1 Tax=Magnetococcus massalia (strain MO-1) TaxID=451514 RepID=A0A1S7LHU2_MAGMO|nr:conserved protein of unknown function [Candidatus Magnetococcus massalia]
MSHPVHDLQHLIASQRPVLGWVVAINGSMVRVATAQGMVETHGNGITLGERVVLVNGIAHRASKSSQIVTHRV